MDTLNQLNASLGNYLAVMHQNPVLNGVISVAILMYASILAPALPNTIIRLFDTIIGKLIFIFLIAYVSGKNISVALVLSVAFTLLLMLANSRLRAVETFETQPASSMSSAVSGLNIIMSKVQTILLQLNATAAELGNQEIQGDIDELATEYQNLVTALREKENQETHTDGTMSTQPESQQQQQSGTPVMPGVQQQQTGTPVMPGVQQQQAGTPVMPGVQQQQSGTMAMSGSA